MARMHPPTLARDEFFDRKDARAPSDAEILVFDAFRTRLDGKWDVYYSVWLRDTAGPLHAEADFVAISPDAILLFEVKGGVVERTAAGRWKFTTKKGTHSDEKDRGPDDQVRDAWYALRRHCNANCDSGMVDGHLWGYGIITPECMVRFSGPDPAIPTALWLDESGFPERTAVFVGAVIAYWRADFDKRARDGATPKPFGTGDRAQLDQALRPVIRCIYGAGVEARDVERQVVKLTIDQCRALDYAQLDERLVVQGGAGTGKTLVALEKASREASTGKKVGFVCFNRLLAEHLARDDRLRSVEVLTYHQLVHRIVSRAGGEQDIPEDWASFNHVATDLVIGALDQLGGQFRPWDYLVVDEAQDLMSDQFFSVLDLILRGGLSRGRWLVSLDTEQSIFSQQFDRAYFEKLVLLGNARTLVLPDNCRNTRQIAAYSHSIGDVPEQSRGVIDGRFPRIEYFHDEDDFSSKFKKCVNRLIAEFREARLDVSRITVLLLQRGRTEELVMEAMKTTLAKAHVLRVGDRLDPMRVSVSTVQAFKGLESDAVVVVGATDLGKDWQKKLFYVASTRARSILEVLLPSSQHRFIEDATPAVMTAMLRR